MLGTTFCRARVRMDARKSCNRTVAKTLNIGSRARAPTTLVLQSTTGSTNGAAEFGSQSN
jgi:hypothetical protein